MVNYINNKKALQLNPNTLYNLDTNPSACNNYNCINNQIPNTIQQYGYEIPSVLDLATLVSPTSPNYQSFSPTQQAQNMRNSAQNQPSQTGPAQSQYNEAAQDLAVREVQNIDATQPYNPETLPTPAMINEQNMQNTQSAMSSASCLPILKIRTRSQPKACSISTALFAPKSAGEYPLIFLSAQTQLLPSRDICSELPPTISS